MMVQVVICTIKILISAGMSLYAPAHFRFLGCDFKLQALRLCLMELLAGFWPLHKECSVLIRIQSEAADIQIFFLFPSLFCLRRN